MFVFGCVFRSGLRKRPADEQEMLLTPSKRIKKLEMTNPGKEALMALDGLILMVLSGLVSRTV